MANLGYIQLIRACNQACRICSNPDSSTTLSLAQAQSQIDDLVQRHYQGVILTGGEPTLSPIALDVIRYACEKGLSVRLITNGSRLSDRAQAKAYVKAGLGHVHVSLYSSRAQDHDSIAQVGGAHENACRAIELLGELGVTVDINTVIQKLNCDNLDALASLVLQRFPWVRHVVFNNLDPTMGRAERCPELIHRLGEMEASLIRALGLLRHAGRTFRVERVPLCYMAEYAEASTETRKIIKGEERLIHFLDSKGSRHQTCFRHGKAPVCQACSLQGICAGLFAMGKGYDARELAPLFIDPQPIICRVLGG